MNALRGHLAEFGVIAPQGLRNVGDLIAIVRADGDTRLPDVARQVLQVLANQIEQIEAAISALERQLLAWHKTNPMSQRLASIPGIGPIIATAIATTVTDPNVFRSGREFAAWLGLVPRQNSTGGKTRLGGITKRGNRYLRRLLINGASANLLRSKATKADPWVIGLRRRRPPLVVAVALANKTARIAWAMMHRNHVAAKQQNFAWRDCIAVFTAHGFLFALASSRNHRLRFRRSYVPPHLQSGQRRRDRVARPGERGFGRLQRTEKERASSQRRASH